MFFFLVITCKQCKEQYHTTCNHSLTANGLCFRCVLPCGMKWDNNSCTVDGIITMFDHFDAKNPGYLKELLLASVKSKEHNKALGIINAVNHLRNENFTKAHESVISMQDSYDKKKGLVGSSDLNVYDHLNETRKLKFKESCQSCGFQANTINYYTHQREECDSLAKSVDNFFEFSDGVCKKCKNKTLVKNIHEDSFKDPPPFIMTSFPITKNYFKPTYGRVTLDDINQIKRTRKIGEVEYDLAGIELVKVARPISHATVLMEHQGHWVHYDGLNHNKKLGFYRIPNYRLDPNVQINHVVYMKRIKK